MSRRGFGRRKTVLQLTTTPQQSYGFGYKPPDAPLRESGVSALNLMANYEDSEEDEDIEQPTSSSWSSMTLQKFVASSQRLEPSSVLTVPPPEPSTKPSTKPSMKPSTKLVSNGRSVSPDTTKPSKPKDEIDSKVLDFLAELETIDGPDTTSDSVDGNPLPDTPDGSSEFDSTDDEFPEPKQPEEPTTEWQQCMDESTECFYYWHYVTNEVTWEIPSEYSQFLLRYKEYEEQLLKYEKEKAEWEKIISTMPPRKKKKRVKKRKDGNSLPTTEDEKHNSTVYGPMLPKSRNGEVESSNSVINSSQRERNGQPPLPPEPSIGPQLPESTVQLSSLIGPQLPPPPPPPEEDVTPSVIGPELPSSSSHQDKSDSGKEDTDADIFDDDIDLMLEEPVYSKYEQAKRTDVLNRTDTAVKSDPVIVAAKDDDDVDDDEDIDLDDIDAELERALERKKSELQAMDSSSNKRKAPVEDPSCSDVQRKRPKTQEGPVGAEAPDLHRTPRILKDDIKKKVDSLAELTELATLVTDKLDFLDVTDVGLSKLQILLIQIETRTADWKAGGLNTDHFLRSLQDASQQLEQYEISAAPTGWSCHWDRKFKRYFYCNNLTEETQWDYPVESDYVEPSTEKQAPQLSCVPPEPMAIEAISPYISSAYNSATYPAPPPEYDPNLFVAPPPPPPPPEEPSLVEYPVTPETSKPAHPLLSLHPVPFISSLSDNNESAMSQVEFESSVISVPLYNSAPPPPQDGVISAPPMPTTSEFVCENMDGMECDDSMDEPLPPGVDPVIVQQPVISKPPPPTVRQIDNNVQADIDGIPMGDVGETSLMPDEQAEKENGEIISEAVTPQDPTLTDVAESGLPTQPELVASNGQIPSSSQTESIATVTKEKKKKKKDKSLVGGGLLMKKKKVSGLVEKWQQVQKDVKTELAKEQKVVRAMEEELAALSNS